MKRRVTNDAGRRTPLQSSVLRQIFEMRQRLAQRKVKVHALQLAAEHVRQQVGGGSGFRAYVHHLLELFVMMPRQIVDPLLETVKRRAVRRQDERVGRQRSQTFERRQI